MRGINEGGNFSMATLRKIDFFLFCGDASQNAIARR
jgi:hypothetical protein